MVVSTGTRPAQIAINRENHGSRPPVLPSPCLVGGGLALSKIKAPGFGAPIEPKTRKESRFRRAHAQRAESSDLRMQQGGADDAAL